VGAKVAILLSVPKSILSGNEDSPMPKLYSSLADWWPLLSPPADYAEESAIYAKHLIGCGTPRAFQG
jgi:hypothetical protein